MIRDTLTLVKLNLDISRAEAGGDLRYWLRNLLIVVAVVAGAVVSAVAGHLLTNGLEFYTELGVPIEPYVIPGVFFSAAFVMFLFQHIRKMLTSLFLAGDLERLLVSPVNTGAIFISRMLQGLRWNYLTSLSLAVPALFLYGIRMEMGLLYFVFVIVILALLPLLTRSIAALLILFLAHAFPAQRLNEVFTAFMLLGFSPVVLHQLSTIGETEQVQETPAETAAFLQNFAHFDFPVLRLGAVTTQAGLGEVAAGSASLLVVFVLTGVLFAVTVILAQRFFASGFLEMSGAGVKKQAAKQGDRSFTASSMWRVFLHKDALALVRDPRLFMRVVSSSVMVIVPLAPLLLTILRDPDGAETATPTVERLVTPVIAALSTPGLIVVVLVIGFLLWLAIILATFAFSQEGRQFEILKLAPVAPQVIVRSKWVAVFTPFAVLATVLLFGLGLALGYILTWIGYMWLMTIVAGGSIIMFFIGFSLPGVRLDWEDANRIGIKTGLSLLVLLIGFVLLAAYVALGLAGFVLETTSGSDGSGLYPLGVLVITLISAALLYVVSLRYGTRHLLDLGE